MGGRESAADVRRSLRRRRSIARSCNHIKNLDHEAHEEHEGWSISNQELFSAPRRLRGDSSNPSWFRDLCGEKCSKEGSTMNAITISAAVADWFKSEFCRLLSRPADATEPGYCRAAARPVWRATIPSNTRGRSSRPAITIPRTSCRCSAQPRSIHRPGTIMGGVVLLHDGIVAARAHRVDCKCDGSARKASCAHLSVDHGPAGFGWEQPRADPALSHGRIHRPLVDVGRFCRYLHRRPGAAPASDVGEARSGSTIFRWRWSC